MRHILAPLVLVPLLLSFSPKSFYGVKSDAVPLQQCKSPLAQDASPPSPVNLWASLTTSETSSIQAWLGAPERQLNLTPAAESTLSDNTIFLIESYYPSKADALAHLSSPNTVSPPDRFARVTIHHGGDSEPSIKDYLVGPLPISEQTTMAPLTDIYRRDLPYNARGFISIVNELGAVFQQFTPELVAAIEDLFNATFQGGVNDTLTAGGGGPFSFDGSFRRVWVFWKRLVPGSWLHPISFFNYFDISGTDPSQWRLLKIVYNNQLFNSSDDFLHAYRNGTLERPTVSDPSDASWSSRKRVGSVRDLDDLPGPRSVSFAGLRFRVDRDRQYVSWMGWGMYLGFDRDMGLSLWDIRFKDERLIYQLAPQEAVTQYSGTDPMQTTSAYLDRFFGMGSDVRDLLPGYDCPQESVYLPATTYTPLGSVTVEKAICIFEQDTGKPITRHMGDPQESGAIKGYVLVFDYTFHFDGTIEVRVSASGYLQGGYWQPQNDAYGCKIHNVSMGTVHDHIMNFKVDLDIAGQENSLLETTTAQEEITLPWFDDDWGQTVVQQKITRKFISNESDVLLMYPPNFQGHYSIVNQDAKNAWENPRGYVLHPGASPIHNTVVGSKRLLENANWARYNLAVSRRKDTEPSSSTMWNANLPGSPAVNFHDFFDGESLVQEDLVMWINVGMHHLPTAEDSPNTKTNIATSSFLLTPLNYFDYDVTMESKNAILLTTTPEQQGGAYGFDDFGVNQSFNCIPEAPPPFEYSPSATFD
ncbi:amine oxidase catalytic domain-containing protein [Dendrothele bispora CBS 962.96]|uniref:Amine oxidase n=1 Tax=Dendrothele bispora (strain CBS 962.96) TaxID=1314807 RepID=A0A4S8LQC1_DENBC|nr:amine oxidase catalytic domain-containing protein [Dendrothele bispora CBS 962.96]